MRRRDCLDDEGPLLSVFVSQWKLNYTNKYETFMVAFECSQKLNSQQFKETHISEMKQNGENLFSIDNHIMMQVDHRKMRWTIYRLIHSTSIEVKDQGGSLKWATHSLYFWWNVEVFHCCYVVLFQRKLFSFQLT